MGWVAVRRALPAAGLPAAGGLTVLAGWWMFTATSGVRAVLVPSPPQVAAVFTDRPGFLLRHAATTLREVLQGYGIAAAGGVVLGVVLAGVPLLGRAWWPLLVGLDAVPKLALAPLLVVWLGFGTTPKVVMVVLTCLLPIVLTTATGLSSTPPQYVELARSLSASWWRTLLKIRLPQAVPGMFVGLRLAAPLAVIGAVIGELFGATAGLGYLIRTAGSDTALVFACLLLLAGLSLALFHTVSALQRLTAPWAAHTTD
jgi:NitT/TauT family transport system permease protein